MVFFLFIHKVFFLIVKALENECLLQDGSALEERFLSDKIGERSYGCQHQIKSWNKSTVKQLTLVQFRL